MNDELNKSEEILSADELPTGGGGPMSELTPFEQLVTDSQVISWVTKLKILDQPNDSDHGKTCGCWGTETLRLCSYHEGFDDGVETVWTVRSKWTRER